MKKCTILPCQFILILYKNFHFHDDLMWLIDLYGKWNAEMDANKFIYFNTHRTDRFIVRSFSLGFCAHFYSFGGYILLCRSFLVSALYYFWYVVLIGDFVNIYITADIHKNNRIYSCSAFIFVNGVDACAVCVTFFSFCSCSCFCL